MESELKKIINCELGEAADAARRAMDGNADPCMNIEISLPSVYAELALADEECIAEVQFSLHPNAKKANLELLMVDANYQFQGIGSAIAKAVERICSQAGIEEISLNPMNDSARLFWTLKGYASDESTGGELMVKYI